ncbi:DNA-binding GntR family transcriptional regulator [Planktotalea frisia]|jgi:DNA-binding GntR family transcriptional regulator|uniref:HTH-type transcriptional regulator LutR n=1 Tax=Planktotalea frisia TaxID=696762 RepID=A0A1L9NWR8_9RHOB|nr:GntR family transcriptional regulator [Planktotalea frisia]OJI93736.1 HTH-type transcriptional regulator LutR [Planktotalea frisia]PZX28840.1 DNA-binding GntR family transcriptional regulator [Planktotalea frisia]
MQSAYDQLFQAIETGELKPADRLLETELATRFGVSRTPVREAIRRLEAEGIVIHMPRVGAVVRTLGQQEIVELYEMRIVLETTAAAMAAKHASGAEIRTLEGLNEDMAQNSGDPIKVAILNRAFHHCIMQAARNQFLAHSYHALSHALILLGKTTLETDARVATVVAQHADIIEALKAANPDDAADKMRQHMEASLDHRLKALHIAP